MNVRNYLQESFELAEGKPSKLYLKEFTVVHISNCTAHTTKTFLRNLVKHAKEGGREGQEKFEFIQNNFVFLQTLFPSAISSNEQCLYFRAVPQCSHPHKI